MPGSNSRNRRRGSGVGGEDRFEQQIRGALDFVGLGKRTIYRRDSNGQKIKVEQEVRDGEYVTVQEEPIPGDFGYREPNRTESGVGIKRTGPYDTGGGGLSSDYKDTEKQAFAKAEAWQKHKQDFPRDYSGNLDQVNIGSSGFEKPGIEKIKFTHGKNKAQTGEKFAPAFGKSQLRYPYENTQTSQDYLRFNIFKYQRGTNQDNQPKLYARGVGDQTVLARDILGSILLPVPSQIGDSNNVQYGESKLNSFAAQGFELGSRLAQSEGALDALRNTIDGLQGALDTASLPGNRNLIRTALVASAVNQFGANLDVNSVLARESGQIINPNMELLFNSPALRQFKFRFKFTPRFEQETLEVKRIIKAFKKNMAAKGGASGALLKTPNIFQLQYVRGDGRPQGFLHEFKLCALQSCAVNYTGDGVHATYYDGTPVSMTVDLAFQELSPVYNEDYDLRDNTDGVGF